MRSLQIYRETSFSKGMNDTLPPEHLERGYLADALNCFIRSDEIVKRYGYSLIGDDLGSTAIQGLKGIRFANGTKELLMVRNGTIYKWTGSGNWSSLGGTLATSGSVDIVIANNNAYFFDGTNTIAKYNGTTVSTVAAIPIGTGARWFHNMLFVFGISATPNTVRISNLGDPEDFSGGTTATIAVNPNDGDRITAMGELNDELIIFKTQRVWSLSGFGTSTLTLSNLNEKITGFGTLAPRSIVNTGNDLVYLSFLGDVPHFRSLKRTTFATVTDGGIISENIETSMKNLNKSALDVVAGVYDGRNIWYAVPNESSTFNNKVLMIDWLSKGWVRHSGIQASVFEVFAISTTTELYFGEASADSKVYKMSSSATSDNSSAINFQVISRRYGGDMPESKKKWKYLYITAKETGNYDLTVDYAKDGFTYDNLGTMNLSGTGAVFDNIILDTSKLGATDVKRKRFNLPKAVGFYTQYKMYDTSATSSVTIRDWETLYFPRQIREI